MNILIIEDDPRVADFLERGLRAASKGSKRKVAKKHSKRLRNLGAYAYPAKRH